MKKLIIWLSCIFATFAFAAAGDKAIFVNPNQDGDSYIQINDGGTQKTVLQVTGSTGAVTIGSTVGGATQHNIQSGQNTSVWLKGVGSSSDLAFSRTGASPGSAAISGSSGSMSFFTGASNPNTPFATNVGGFNSTGSWTLGPNSFTGQHRINGNIGLPSTVGGNPATTFGTALLGNTGSCAGVGCNMTMDFTLPGISTAFVGGTIDVSGNAFNGPNPVGAVFNIRGRKDLSPICVTVGTSTTTLLNSITCTFPSAGVVRITLDGNTSDSITAFVSGMLTFWD